MRIHHVQLACPRGGEDAARAFYVAGLGMTEVPKPAELARRGGCWFRWYDDDGSVASEIHIGVEEPFSPARKAHPALLVGSVAELEGLGARLAAARFEVDWRERLTFDGHERCHAFDGAGNRVELLAGVPKDTLPPVVTHE